MADVLAVGPHPDDVELAAGGTLARLVRCGHHVHLADLTAGERSTRGTPELRADEADRARRAIGADARIAVGLPDGGVDARDPEQIAALVDVLRRIRPGLVIAMHWNDDHPDHREGGDLVRRAVYLSGLRNYPGRDGNAFRPQRVIYAMGRRPFTPSLVVDVSGDYGTKRAAVAAYRSQFHREADDPLVTPISDPSFLPRLEGRDRYYGGMIGVEFGEPFFHEGPWPVPGLDAWFEEGAGA